MKQYLLIFVRTHKELSVFVLLALISFVVSQCSGQKKEPTLGEEQGPADTNEITTFIPKGFSLVPLEIANYQTLDSIFGPFGVVDLYVQDVTARNFSRLVAKNVKLLRAPKNPSHFAALVPSTEIAKLMQFGGPFFAVIQNPKTTGTAFENEPLRTRSRIQYNLGE